MIQLANLDTTAPLAFQTESEVEAFADNYLRGLTYTIKHKKTGNPSIDKCWPSKSTGAKVPGAGKPDIFVYLPNQTALPWCVWENKAPNESATLGLTDAKFYIEGIHSKNPSKPNLPRLAAGYNGKQLLLAYFNHGGKWFDLKVEGSILSNTFPLPAFAANGISSTGNFLASAGAISAKDLRSALPALKTLYRSIPCLASGRWPIDFTIGLLTLKMLVELHPEWGTWAEQPSLISDASSVDQAIAERLKTLTDRVLNDPQLFRKYGDIFRFQEKSRESDEVAFDFLKCLAQITQGQSLYQRLFEIMDGIPPLHGAEFDIFGEVYQVIGDESTKKALGEFFTGRHIIAGLIPIFFERAGVTSFLEHLKDKKIADIACGTGGFLTETLRYVRKRFSLDERATKNFAGKAFFGYDLSKSNASRARVNMYFAGDGFSAIEGATDSLSKISVVKNIKSLVDFLLTNPPYGSSAHYQRLEDAFLRRSIECLKPGSGWALLVLPNGVLENPRSAPDRLELLKNARVTDVISLPPHSFAPYTKQKTCVVFFQRRAQPINVANWKDLLEEIADEQIALFIVDNDGFANSDKRYETDRQHPSGEWLHNDLTPWVDAVTGKARRSKIANALLKDQQPKLSTNEFGVPQGLKYGRFSFSELAHLESLRGASKSSGIDLVPEIYLRPPFSKATEEVFLSDASRLVSRTKSSKLILKAPAIRDEIRRLLATPVSFDGLQPITETMVSDVFHCVKGDPGLTESLIYQYFDETGIPVFGGGEAPPRFFIRASAKTKSSSAVTIHQGPALIVSMDGSSGSVRTVKKGKFACNHHACVLVRKKGKKLDLDFAAQQIEGIARSISSNRDGSATLTKPALESLRFTSAPSIVQEDTISKIRNTLIELRDKLL